MQNRGDGLDSVDQSRAGPHHGFDQQPQVLTLIAELPEVLTLTPHDLRWADGEARAAKVVCVLLTWCSSDVVAGCRTVLREPAPRVAAAATTQAVAESSTGMIAGIAAGVVVAALAAAGIILAVVLSRRRKRNGETADTPMMVVASSSNDLDL